MPHGNLKPANIILEGPQYEALLTDFGLHRLMTPEGIAEQILNLGALGYRAPELASAPSFNDEVYLFGVILMELLTTRSASDIISGQFEKYYEIVKMPRELRMAKKPEVNGEIRSSN